MKPTTSPSSPIEATAPKSIVCPCCQSAFIEELYLFPMTLQDLDRAAELKRQEALAKSQSQEENENGKRERSNSLPDEDFGEVHSESAYLMLLSRESSSMVAGPDGESLRTGRWTDEETAYVDFLLEAFDRGQLPIPQGIRLNDFLRDVLLCKASRLTKKMKHAKLSARSYDMRGDLIHSNPVLNRSLLSSLEHSFLESIAPEAAKLELRFNITKAWRMFLSNVCLQVCSSMLNANDWIASLDSMERRATEAEETIRKARRRRMGMALKKDMHAAPLNGVFFSGLPVKRQVSDAPSKSVSMPTVPSMIETQKGANQSVSSSDEGENEFISQMLDLGQHFPMGGQHSTDNLGMHDFSVLFDALTDNAPQAEERSDIGTRNCGPFLEAIVSFVEKNNFPFEHIDLWVPSYGGASPGSVSNANGELRLVHAGHVTRSDIDSFLQYKLHEYGEYSVRFSFASGVGLPGRVYESCLPSWERNIDQADPSVFKRAGAAKIYGVKTGLGIPLFTNVVGRMVVSMYSTRDLSEDCNIVQLLQQELISYSPEPKWKLVVEMRNPPSDMSNCCSSKTSEIARFSHERSSSVASYESATGSVYSSYEVEQRIVTLLGNHMPHPKLASKPDNGPFPEPNDLLPFFMSLRLLLLRAPSRRSEEEKEAIDVILKSFNGYTQDSRRTDQDLAFLLIHDWRFLTMSITDKPAVSEKPKATDSSAYKCHVMNAPVSTYSHSGVPTKMPSSLSFVEPSTLRSSSIDHSSSIMHGQVSPVNDGLSAAAPHSISNINIVDENTD
jgi:hypothetical protein